MKIFRQEAFAIMCVALGASISACARDDAPAPFFPLDQCARIRLTDPVTGAAIFGAEDLGLDRAGGRLIISAYDRRSVESAARKPNTEIPVGGLYAAGLDELSDGREEALALPLVEPALIAGGLRPHGLSFDEATGELAFINRAYHKAGSRWRMSAQIMSLSPSGELRSTEPAACSANDIAIGEGRALVTLDHGACGWRATFEDVFNLKRASLVDLEGKALVSGIGFANGVAASPDGAIVVAATREQALHLISFDDGAVSKSDKILLGAAPDNLTISDEGRIIAAVHPSLLSMGLQRRLGLGRSPSRVVEIDPVTGEQRLLFDDRKAAKISGATVAVSTRGQLFIGSVFEPGLIVCRGAA